MQSADATFGAAILESEKRCSAAAVAAHGSDGRNDADGAMYAIVSEFGVARVVGVS